MSSFVAEIRRNSSDPFSDKIKDIENAIYASDSQNNTLDDDSADNFYTLLQDYDRVRFNDKRSYLNTIPLATNFVITREPDGKFLTCWLLCRNLGTRSIDSSKCNNHAVIQDAERLRLGPGLMDDGIQGGTVSTKFPPNVGGNFYVPDAPNMRLNNQSVGFTVGAVFKSAIDTNPDGYLATKTDDESGNGYLLHFSGGSHELRFNCKKAGSEAKIKATGILKDTIYEIIATANLSTTPPTLKLYLNDTLYTTASTASLAYNTIPETPISNRYDTFIMARDGRSQSNKLEGYLQNFRYEYKKIYTSTEVHNYYINKWTTLNVPFGTPALLGYWFIRPDLSLIGSFSDYSFTSTSFTQRHVTPPSSTPGDSFSDSSFSDPSFT